jgi:hypothetical protein
MADNKQLEERIKVLEKQILGRGQLKFPVDIQTSKIIDEKKLKFEAEATGTVTADKTLRITIDGKIYKINAL